MRNDLRQAGEFLRLTSGSARRKLFPRRVFLLSQSRIPAPLPSPALPGEQARSSFRGKTIATRLTLEELAEVEAAAEGEGKTVAEWLREVALRSARQPAGDPIELLAGRADGDPVRAPEPVSRHRSGERGWMEAAV